MHVPHCRKKRIHGEIITRPATYGSAASLDANYRFGNPHNDHGGGSSRADVKEPVYKTASNLGDLKDIADRAKLSHLSHAWQGDMFLIRRNRFSRDADRKDRNSSSVELHPITSVSFMKTLTFSLERRFLVCYISVMYIPFPACMTDDSERILEIGVLWSVLHQGQVHLRVFAKDFDPFLPKEDLRNQIFCKQESEFEKSDRQTTVTDTSAFLVVCLSFHFPTCYRRNWGIFLEEPDHVKRQHEINKYVT
ncbi:hypothetical protein RRG08_066600 [Elysia crispata]|uniref:Uncharacterized protein n=1 Tax=Elysia crispata TaxID=231223 RepID=A0AAE1CML7_9GAST|nr:hypothetical protein RRG08_066600 [Elysia crispata]